MDSSGWLAVPPLRCDKPGYTAKVFQHMKQSYRIGIDMDDVICDTHRAILGWAETEFGLSLLDRADQQIDHLLDSKQLEVMTHALNRGMLFRTLPAMDGAIEVIGEMVKSHDVFIVTAAMEHPGSLWPKFEWVQEFMPFFDPLKLVFCGDKSIVEVDYLIDDTPHHFEKLSGTGIVYDAPKNRAETRFRRVRNWREIAEMFDLPAPS